jgi:two-component system chemotaxis sensor kinase CheA
MPSAATQIPRVAKPVVETAASGILVVDDSITSRSLERSILEAHGYRVRVAVDGLEALEMLQVEKADLIITDIQMPRMDGFALVEALKADSHLNKIPVIIVSSLEKREDQERGLLLGADAYVVKRKFDQTELLDAIRLMI